jgi:hypothetical protein
MSKELNIMKVLRRIEECPVERLIVLKAASEISAGTGHKGQGAVISGGWKMYWKIVAGGKLQIVAVMREDEDIIRDFSI